VHATAVFLKPLEKLAIFDTNAVPEIRVPRGTAGREIIDDGKWIAVHPGSGSERKNWPEQRWVQLLRWIQRDTGRKVLLVGGEAEGDRLLRIAQALDRERTRLAERRPLVELAGILERCDWFLGHDSGITHLAAAVGCKVVTLWGPSKRTIWTPLNDKVTVVEAERGDLESLQFERVVETIRGLIG
jgi:heptosyltransferase-3